MDTLDAHNAIKPTRKDTVYEILKSLRCDLGEWHKIKGGKSPASNPRFCYNWAFERPNKFIVVCLWHARISATETALLQADNLRSAPDYYRGVSTHVWRRRAGMMDRHIQTAYLCRLPVRAIILDGKRRSREHPNTPARVKKRMLDPVTWAVTEYDFASGDFILMRGAKPVAPNGESIDVEMASFREGAPRRAFRTHRHREQRVRDAKIAEALRANGGRLVCQVPRCGFDFQKQYGDIGAGYAHVHHLAPLSNAPNEGRITKLSELAVVCANCHAMIHLGGECRELRDLIPRKVRDKTPRNEGIK